MAAHTLRSLYPVGPSPAAEIVDSSTERPVGFFFLPRPLAVAATPSAVETRLLPLEDREGDGPAPPLALLLAAPLAESVPAAAVAAAGRTRGERAPSLIVGVSGGLPGTFAGYRLALEGGLSSSPIDSTASRASEGEESAGVSTVPCAPTRPNNRNTEPGSHMLALAKLPSTASLPALLRLLALPLPFAADNEAAPSTRCRGRGPGGVGGAEGDADDTSLLPPLPEPESSASYTSLGAKSVGSA